MKQLDEPQLCDWPCPICADRPVPVNHMLDLLITSTPYTYTPMRIPAGESVRRFTTEATK